MSPPRTRRDLLRATGPVTLGLLAGCGGANPVGGSPTPTATPNPDLGRDSYGILARNETDREPTIRARVTRPFEDVTIFDETVTLAAGEQREWNRVITEEKEWAVTAALQGDVDTPDRLASDSLWLTPGEDDAPDVENIEVVLIHEHDVTMVSVTHAEVE